MKTILFYSFIHGNMESLIDYYDKNHKKEYKIIYFDFYKIYNNPNKLVYFIEKSKYFFKKYDLVIADYPTRLLKSGKESIYMDHGSGLKVMPGFNELNDKKSKIMSECIRSCNYFILQSDREIEIEYRSPELDKKYGMDMYISLGQPRNDKLFDKKYIEKSKKEIYQKYNLSDKCKLILLAPTWRGYDFDDKGMFNEDKLNKLNDFLFKNGYKLMYRPHYMEDIVGKKKFNNFKSFIYADILNEPDAQKIVASSDFLITDYSGILVEFLALDKPIAFLNLDVEKYKSYRGLAIDYYNDVHTPGPKISSVDDLIEYINNINNGTDTYGEYRQQAKKFYYKYYDGLSCKRIWNQIDDML